VRTKPSAAEIAAATAAAAAVAASNKATNKDCSLCNTNTKNQYNYLKYSVVTIPEHMLKPRFFQNPSVTSVPKNFVSFNNNNDRLTAFDPGQPG